MLLSNNYDIIKKERGEAHNENLIYNLRLINTKYIFLGRYYRINLTRLSSLIIK